MKLASLPQQIGDFRCCEGFRMTAHRLRMATQRSTADAVGTLIAERPPHRTVRAAFPHTAPTSGV